jgi:parallel beta-helix repeat protein
MKRSMHRIARLAINNASAARSPAKLRLTAWFSALALAFGVQQLSASTTYIVGTCASGTQFSTIQAALDASPAPTTVEVCPGVYNEQLTITKPVTVEGITGNQNGVFGGTGNGSMAQIAPPASMNVITLQNGGSPVTASPQIYVDNVSGGDVNLTNLDVQGMYASGQGMFFVGIVYQGSSGTINHVITSMQSGPSGESGFGMWIEGSSSKPSVTVENSTIHDFSTEGMVVIGSTDSASDLTATIKNNVISNFSSQTTYDVDLDVGSTPTFTGNFVSGGLYGICLCGAPSGSVSGNTVFGNRYGIELAEDGPSVTSNNIYGTQVNGIDIQAPSLESSVVESNTIRTVNPPDSEGDAIELNCNNISSSKVHSNTIVDAWVGYDSAPAGFGGSNTYYGVALDVNSCSSGAVSKRASSAARPTSMGRVRAQ